MMPLSRHLSPRGSRMTGTTGYYYPEVGTITHISLDVAYCSLYGFRDATVQEVFE